jgi:hypothetical protein
MLWLVLARPINILLKMKSKFICKTCIEKATGKSVYDLPVDLFNQIKAAKSFSGDCCLECGGRNLIKVFGIETSYIRGYGFLDKQGVKRDMDMHLMVKNQDPYAEHRKPGEKREVIRKLQKAKEHDKKPKNVHLGH